MVSLFNNKFRPIGLDIGHCSVKMLQLAEYKNSLKISAVDEVSIDATQDAGEYRQQVINAIKKMLSTGQFHGRDVISCLSNDIMKVKSFRLDGSDKNDFENAVIQEAKNKLNIDKENYHIDYVSAGSIRQGGEVKEEVLVLTASNESINGHIQMLEETGMVPISIDCVPNALFRCFFRTYRRQEDMDAVKVYIDIGSTYTTLIIAKGQEICFIKQIPIGGDKLNKMVASKLDITIDEASLIRTKLQTEGQESEMDPASRQVVIDAMNSTIEELAREVSMCLKYFTVTFRGRRPEQAVVSGGEAYELMLVAALTRQLGINVEVARPLRGLEAGGLKFFDDRRKNHCEWAVAVGLGLKGMDESVNAEGVLEYERN